MGKDLLFFWQLSADGKDLYFPDGFPPMGKVSVTKMGNPTLKPFFDGSNHQGSISDGFPSGKVDFFPQFFPDGLSLTVTVTEHFPWRYLALSMTVPSIRKKTSWGYREPVCHSCRALGEASKMKWAHIDCMYRAAIIIGEFHHLGQAQACDDMRHFAEPST
jgi:hypothetical protein